MNSHTLDNKWSFVNGCWQGRDRGDVATIKRDLLRHYLTFPAGGVVGIIAGVYIIVCGIQLSSVCCGVVLTEVPPFHNRFMNVTRSNLQS